MKKHLIAMAVTFALVIGTCVGAYAAANSSTISALLNPRLKIVYNGVEQQLTDTAGKPVYPISYNNTTYLPVRAISDLVDLPIEFDSERYAVVMGTVEKKPTSLVKLGNSGGTKFSSIIRDANELKVTTGDGLQTYSSGIYWNIWNGNYSANLDRSILFDVKGYSTVTFTAWSDVDAGAMVYDQDGNIVSNFKIAANSAVTKTLELDSSITKIGFAADGPLGETGTMKILDPMV